MVENFIFCIMFTKWLKANQLLNHFFADCQLCMRRLFSYKQFVIYQRHVFDINDNVTRSRALGCTNNRIFSVTVYYVYANKRSVMN